MSINESAHIPLVGNGFDVHPLVYGRKLILGGVHIPYEKGLDGHSDADVLLHSIIDALLGALGLRDIGILFPDSEKEFKGISSISLLGKVLGHQKFCSWQVINIDSTIVAQKPRIAEYIPVMKDNLTRIIKPVRWINIKATTTEKLGFTGRGEGIAAFSVCVLSLKSQHLSNNE